MTPNSVFIQLYLEIALRFEYVIWHIILLLENHRKYSLTGVHSKIQFNKSPKEREIGS